MKLKILCNRRVCCFLILAMLLCSIPLHTSAKSGAYSIAQVQSMIEGIIDWKKQNNGATLDGPLINSTFLQQAGTTPGDWFPIGLGRYGYPDDYDGYLAVITEVVQEKYKTDEKLSFAKATEWHRISLAILAMGGDPTRVGRDVNGEPINLIADGTYNRGKTASLGRQGINGWIWSLIALDAMRYEIPSGAFNSRGDIIVEILRQQLSDGGFALTGRAADPDVTAMAIQALAPYYNSNQTYTYQCKPSGQTVTKTAGQVIDQALVCLSDLQLTTGDFKSWGTQNVESTAQVVVALCCLGLDPQTDSRFMKNGATLLDGMMRYRAADGGFAHSFEYDPDNPTSQPGKSNSMASEQVLYSMVAIWRQQKGMRTLYDFRPEGGSNANIVTQPANVTNNAPDMKVGQEPDGKEGQPLQKTDSETPLLYFSPTDQQMTDELSDPLTTQQYVDVIKLLSKLEQSEDFEGRQVYYDKLIAAKDEILAIQAEVDAINQEILDKLYPFDTISIADRGAVYQIVSRYQTLSAYDKDKITGWDDVMKTKTQIDNLTRALAIAIVLAIAACIAAVIIVRRIKRRKHKNKREMAELAAQYEDDDA